MKTQVDYCEVDKLKPVPADLSKLSNVVFNVAVKKLVIKVNAVDTKISSTSGLVRKTV